MTTDDLDLEAVREPCPDSPDGLHTWDDYGPSTNGPIQCRHCELII